MSSTIYNIFTFRLLVWKIQPIQVIPTEWPPKSARGYNSVTVSPRGLRLSQLSLGPKVTPYTNFCWNRRGSGVRPQSFCGGMPHHVPMPFFRGKMWRKRTISTSLWVFSVWQSALVLWSWSHVAVQNSLLYSVLCSEIGNFIFIGAFVKRQSAEVPKQRKTSFFYRICVIKN